MSLVAILGAGEIGGAAARALAMRARVGVIRLIDEMPNIADGKALDLSQAAPIIGSDTRIEGAHDYSAAAGAQAIVLADPAAAPGSEWSGEAALALLRRLGQFGFLETSVLIFAGSTHRVLMQQALDELGFTRRRTIGSAPEAFAATARALVAVEANQSAAQVALTVMGRLPDRLVIPWNEGSIGGSSVASVLTPPQLHRVETRLRGLWPPGSTALGTSAALAAEAVIAGSRRIFSTFVSLDRDNGTRAPVCAWPVSLGPNGLERIASPALTSRDRVIMDGVLE
jgi:malate dehydrogenase